MYSLICGVHIIQYYIRCSMFDHVVQPHRSSNPAIVPIPSVSKASQCQDRPSLEQAAVGDDAPEGRRQIGEDHLGGRQHGHATQGQAEVTLPATLCTAAFIALHGMTSGSTWKKHIPIISHDILLYCRYLWVRIPTELWYDQLGRSQLPGLWPSCSANKQPGINWLSIPSTWASSFLVTCCCRLHPTNTSTCHLVLPPVVSCWFHASSNQTKVFLASRAAMFTKIKQTKATSGGRFSCTGSFSAAFCGATSLVGETTEVSSFCEATVVMGPTTEKAILARLATCTGSHDLWNVEEQGLSQISWITHPRWGNSKTKVCKSIICTIKHKSISPIYMYIYRYIHTYIKCNIVR